MEGVNKMDHPKTTHKHNFEQTNRRLFQRGEILEGDN